MQTIHNVPVMPRSALALPIIVPLLWLLVLQSPAAAQTHERPVQFEIAAGNLADALDVLGEQSGVQIMYEPGLVKGISVGAVRGTFTVRDALMRLLAQTALEAERVNDKTVILKHSAPPHVGQSQNRGGRTVRSPASGSRSSV